MKNVTEVYKDQDIIKCDCGSHAFFDWGVKLVLKQNFGNDPRSQEWTHDDNVRVCCSCHKPVLIRSGEIYDCSELISVEEIKSLIEQGRAKKHLAPVRAMDP